MTKKEYEAKMAALEPLEDEQRKSITCSLLGHSHITEGCLGEIFCARCGEQVGDYFLRGYYDPLEINSIQSLTREEDPAWKLNTIKNWNTKTHTSAEIVSMFCVVFPITA